MKITRLGVVLAVVGVAMLFIVTISSQTAVESEWVNAHNIVRETEGMPPLTWNPYLGNSAQCYANVLAENCVGGREGLQHSFGPYGENLASGGGEAYSPTYITNKWYNEKSNYDTVTKKCRIGAADCGHFTQVMWKSTKFVGCAIATCSNSTYYACQYIPPGNVNGFDYERGILSPPTTEPGVPPARPVSGDWLSWINAKRTSRGLKELSYNEILASYAQVYTDVSAGNDGFKFQAMDYQVVSRGSYYPYDAVQDWTDNDPLNQQYDPSKDLYGCGNQPCNIANMMFPDLTEVGCATSFRLNTNNIPHNTLYQENLAGRKAFHACFFVIDHFTKSDQVLLPEAVFIPPSTCPVFQEGLIPTHSATFLPPVPQSPSSTRSRPAEIPSSSRSGRPSGLGSQSSTPHPVESHSNSPRAPLSRSSSRRPGVSRSSSRRAVVSRSSSPRAGAGCGDGVLNKANEECDFPAQKLFRKCCKSNCRFAPAGNPCRRRQLLGGCFAGLCGPRGQCIIYTSCNQTF